MLTPEQRSVLAAMTVTVAGAGGRGGFAVNGLVRLGVGRVRVIDFDRFDASNLNRQLFSALDSIGRGKAETVAAGAAAITGETVVEPIAERLSEGSADRLLGGSGIVFDCLDSAGDKLLLERWCVAHAVPMIHGAVGGWYGQAALIEGRAILGGVYADVSDGGCCEDRADDEPNGYLSGGGVSNSAENNCDGDGVTALPETGDDRGSVANAVFLPQAVSAMQLALCVRKVSGIAEANTLYLLDMRAMEMSAVRL